MDGLEGLLPVNRAWTRFDRRRAKLLSKKAGGNLANGRCCIAIVFVPTRNQNKLPHNAVWLAGAQ
eukprot:scaffold22560_cov135-Cylindrotheca_fusiformis.AAC.88